MKIFLEDSIMVKDKPCTAGSKTLENFTAPFDASVVEKLKEAGYKTGFYKSSEFSLEDPALTETAGGESTALGNDFAGNLRRLAIAKNLAYLYPSYGRVSRYGLVPVVSSMDQIGILAKSPEEAFSLLEVVAGYDVRDGMSQKEAAYKKEEKQKTKTALFKSAFPAVETFTVLAAAEFANNVSRYDGVKFGYRSALYQNLNELYIKSRSEALGTQAKFHAVLGNIVLSGEYYEKYYDKAMRIRRLMKEEVLNALKNSDILEIQNPGREDFCLSPLSGCPSLTFIKNGTAVTALARPMDEDALRAYAKEEGR